MIKPDFFECIEIRMGSPFKACNLRLVGEWAPELPYETWQDVWATSKDKRILGLIAWDIDEKNNPGFRIVVVNERKRTITTSDRIPGCCLSISWEGSGFKYETSGWLPYRT